MIGPKMMPMDLEGRFKVFRKQSVICASYGSIQNHPNQRVWINPGRWGICQLTFEDRIQLRLQVNTQNCIL